MGADEQPLPLEDALVELLLLDDELPLPPAPPVPEEELDVPPLPDEDEEELVVAIPPAPPEPLLEEDAPELLLEDDALPQPTHSSYPVPS